MAVENIITKVNGKNKVIDFRDGLVPAKLEDYAMLHGIGGSRHASNSVIKIVICDYTKGKGSNSRTVYANITPEVCEQLFEICKRNLGTQIVTGDMAFLQEQRAFQSKQHKLAEMQVYLVKRVCNLLSRFVKADGEGKAPTYSVLLASLHQILEKSLDTLTATDPTYTQTAEIPLHTDFCYVQDRVHNYKGKSDNGYAPVQRLQIWHQTYRKGNELSNYPWTVKIINGSAKVTERENGATTFDASTLTNTTEAYIQISDFDFFKMMSRINHFVRIWENIYAADVVRQGEAKRSHEAKEKQQAQNNGVA